MELKLGSSAFSKSSLNIWKFTVHVLLKPGLENFEHYLTSVWKKESEVAQSCPTLCDPMDCSLPGSSLHGILQARVLEWVAISFSSGSSQPRDWTRVSRIPGRRFNLWATRSRQCSVLGLWDCFCLCNDLSVSARVGERKEENKENLGTAVNSCASLETPHAMAPWKMFCVVLWISVRISLLSKNGHRLLQVYP